MINIKANNKFTGYKNFRDITNMSITDLTAGSLNTFINDGEKIEPRAGMGYWGAAGSAGTQTDAYWTLAHRIHSKYDDFVNKQGVKIPLRIFYEGHTAKGDVIQVWLPNYIAGVAQSTSRWYQITATTPSLPLVSTHRYYFAEWFDPTLSVLQPELIFTYGATKIGNWSGGFAPITATTGTTLTTNGIWDVKGFIWSTEGTNIIVVNGVEHTVTAGFGTNTITIASTAGISVNDVAFQNVYFNDTLSSATTYDVCSAINNQVYYIDWNQRNVYISWNRNQVQAVDITAFVGTGLDDAVFSGTYTGTTQENFRVVINTVNPAPVIFTGQGANGLVFDISGYTLTGTTNRYKVILNKVSNTVQALQNSIQYDISTATGAFVQNEVITGGTSGATQTAVWDDQNGSLLLKFNVVGGPFVPGETITGSVSGHTAKVIAYRIDPDSYRLFSYKVFKNDIEIVVASPQLTNTTGAPNAGPFLVADGITFTIPVDIIGTFGPTFTLADFIFYNGALEDGDTWETTVSSTVDTFQWSNGGTLSASVAITGGLQNLSDGIQIKFTSTHGHTIGDRWSTFATQAMARGWSNFTYNNPNRLPGQGFTILLDSNGWTMKPQEHTMLMNAQAGHFYDVEVKLSADLLGETITVTRLKSEPQNKVLFPYLIRYVQNQLSTISQDKTFNILGRQKFLELQQIKTLSDEVRIDFETADWEDADVLYFKRKIYFCIPKMGLIFVYDEYKKYWHTPQQFGKRISLLSVIDDTLVGHSYEQNESYELYTGLNDLGLFPIHTRMVFPYESFGQRMGEKYDSAVGFEGYMLGNPIINYTLNYGLGGCQGQYTGVISPQKTPQGVCLPHDFASLGKSGLGFHGLGNSPSPVLPHFFYIKTFDNQLYYQRNIEIACDSDEQRWSLISLGTQVGMSNINNESITDTS